MNLLNFYNDSKDQTCAAACAGLKNSAHSWVAIGERYTLPQNLMVYASAFPFDSDLSGPSTAEKHLRLQSKSTLNAKLSANCYLKTHILQSIALEKNFWLSYYFKYFPGWMLIRPSIAHIYISAEILHLVEDACERFSGYTKRMRLHCPLYLWMLLRQKFLATTGFFLFYQSNRCLSDLTDKLFLLFIIHNCR